MALGKKFEASVIVLRYNEAPLMKYLHKFDASKFEPLVISEEVDGYYVLMRCCRYDDREQYQSDNRLRK